MFDNSLATLDLDTLDSLGAGPGPGMPSNFKGSKGTPPPPCLLHGVIDGLVGGAVGLLVGGPAGALGGAATGAAVGCADHLVP